MQPVTKMFRKLIIIISQTDRVIIFLDDIFSSLVLIGRCTNEDFWCLSVSGCVDQTMVCDNRIDCWDGSDEFNCCKLQEFNCRKLQRI